MKAYNARKWAKRFVGAALVLLAYAHVREDIESYVNHRIAQHEFLEHDTDTE